jgi:recombination associated protein RdgC
MKELREAVQQELMPRAFTRRRKMYAWIDPVGGWLGVDAPSQTRAEDLLEVLRQTLDTLPLSLVRTERSPAAAMAGWLAGDAPDSFTIDRDTELRSVADEKAAVRYMRHALDGDDVRDHLAAGKLPTKLAMTFDDRVSFVLTKKTEIKRLNFLDVVKEQIDDKETDAQALFDAGFALMTGELRRLLPAVVDALGGELKREPDLADQAQGGAA